MLKKQRALYGNTYNFTPLTFVLPNDYSKFIDIFTKRQLTGEGASGLALAHHGNYYAI